MLDDITTTSTLELNREGRDHLEKIRKWAAFLSILGFIFVGLMVLGGLSVGVLLTALGRREGFEAMPPVFLSFFYIVMGAIYFFPILFLYQFSLYAKQSLQTLNSATLTLALSYLRKHYTYLSVLTMITLALIPIGIIVAVVIAMIARTAY